MKGINKLSEKTRTAHPVPRLCNIKSVKSKRYKVSGANNQRLKIQYSESHTRYSSIPNAERSCAYRYLLSGFVSEYNECIDKITSIVDLAVSNKRKAHGKKRKKKGTGIPEDAIADVNKLVDHANWCYKSYRLQSILYLVIFSGVRCLKRNKQNSDTKCFELLLDQVDLYASEYPSYSLPFLEKGEQTIQTPEGASTTADITETGSDKKKQKKTKAPAKGSSKKRMGSHESTPRSGSKSIKSNTKKNGTNSTSGSKKSNADPPTSYIGRKVSKYFEVEGDWFNGNVIEFEELEGLETWYKVRYDDGDIEELDVTELKKILVHAAPDSEDSEGDEDVSSNIPS